MIMDQYRVVPMRLFGTWEADRAISNCVPRLCTLSLTRLTVFKTLDSDLNCMVIAVKLQGYKRTLRSNDITVVPLNGIIDVDLDISFTLQYPHFIKKKNNTLLVMLQRRRRYKNRPIPGGFKTLAVGVVNLTEVLQSSTSMKELPLYCDLDDEELNATSTYAERRNHGASAKLYLHTLSSQPLEQDDGKLKEPPGEFTDEEEEDSTANDEGGSDSEHVQGGEDIGGIQRPSSGRVKGASGVPVAASNTRGRFGGRHRNFKQKVVALLKKFKISEEEVLKAVEAESQQPTEQEIRDLLEELDNYSNSDPEPDADTISVKSTPKPSLRPYFSSTNASRERLPTIQHSAKDSEESKESAGDSQPDMDTTDPEQPDVTTTSASMMGQSPSILRLGAGLESTTSSTTITHSANSSVVKQHSTSAKETTKSAFSRPTAGRSSDKKKKISPGTRQASADIGGSISSDTSRQQTMLERLHATSASSGRIRYGKDSSASSGFTFPTPLPHQPVSEQLTQILPTDEANLVPDVVVLVSAFDVRCPNLVQTLRDKLTTKLAVLSSHTDVKAVFAAVLNRIQKYCNTNVFQSQNAVKIVLIGADRFFAHCLKSYTELLAQKSNDWLHYLRVFMVGPTWSVVCRCLCHFDHSYSTIFSDNLWRDWWDKSDISQQDMFEVVSRVSRYLNGAKLILHLPIAEAMLQLKDKGSTEEMSNIFVPFVVDVRRAAGESANYADTPQFEAMASAGSPAVPGALSGSPPGTSSTPGVSSPRPSAPTGSVDTPQTVVATGHSSPPGSPHATERTAPAPVFPSSAGEAQDLQIEYWTTVGSQGVSQTSAGSSGSSQKRESGGGNISMGTGGAGGGMGNASGPGSGASTKYSLKTAFKSLIISRLPASPSTLFGDTPSQPPSLVVQFIKERKKDKVLQKLGMKNKEKIESEQKSQSIDGISRLICSAKQHATMNLYIDGVEWTNVKFFQISAQWQTHVKHMPIALFHIDA